MNKQGFVAFYALTVLLILSVLGYGLGFSNITRAITIQYSMFESQTRQTIDAGMAIALRVASTTSPINASYSFFLESGPCGSFTLIIETGTGTIETGVIATVSAILFDRDGQECARRRSRVLIQTEGPGANRFFGGWER